MRYHLSPKPSGKIGVSGGSRDILSNRCGGWNSSLEVGRDYQIESLRC